MQVKKNYLYKFARIWLFSKNIACEVYLEIASTVPLLQKFSSFPINSNVLIDKRFINVPDNNDKKKKF